jgi:hypothetical protein
VQLHHIVGWGDSVKAGLPFLPDAGAARLFPLAAPLKPIAQMADSAEVPTRVSVRRAFGTGSSED